MLREEISPGELEVTFLVEFVSTGGGGDLISTASTYFALVLSGVGIWINTVDQLRNAHEWTWRLTG